MSILVNEIKTAKTLEDADLIRFQPALPVLVKGGEVVGHLVSKASDHVDDGINTVLMIGSKSFYDTVF